MENVENILFVDKLVSNSTQINTFLPDFSSHFFTLYHVYLHTLCHRHKGRHSYLHLIHSIISAYQNDLAFDIRGSQIRPYDEQPSRTSHAIGDWRTTTTTTPGEDTLEMLYQEERQKFLYVKIELEAEIETYKSKLKDVQLLHEQEMFSLKKHNILLKAKVDELVQINKKTADARSKYDPKLMAMQKELERQDNLIVAYESENKKLIQETKRLQNELKATSSQQKPKVLSDKNAAGGNQELFEKVKDLQEENVKLSIEVSALKQKNTDLSLKHEDATQQNSLLQEELEMIRDQLRAKNDFITDRLQAMTTNELELRKQAEDLKVELHSKTEQLRCIKIDYERFQQTIEPVEKELLELRAKSAYYQDKLHTAKHNCEREKQLTQKLKDQVILDNKNIVDLNRQVREMERILKRKNPDSVSALILTANSENERLNLEKVKLLEERIGFLEAEIRAKEDTAQAKLNDIQRKFTDMRDKYSHQVADLESRLLKTTTTTTTTTSPRKTHSEASTQTLQQRVLESRGSEPNLSNNKAGPKSQNLKEDTHLIATIRGLKLELAGKDKTVAKLQRDLAELQKTHRKLGKERERLLAEKRMTASDSKLENLRNDPNSNFYQNGHQLGEEQNNGDTGTTSNNRVKRLEGENGVLREELGRLNKDFAALKSKRLQDLNLLQEEHEKEIALIVKEYSVTVGDTKALKLQVGSVWLFVNRTG